MAYQDQFYTLGTVSVANGSPAVVGTGTGWETALIIGGVFYAGGGAYPISTVESETTLTLAIPYTGLDGAGISYAIDRQRSQATSAVAMNDRLAQIIYELGVENIAKLNTVDLVANQLLYANENADFALSPITAAALALLNLSGEAAGDKFAYLTDDSAAALSGLTAQARAMLASPTPVITSLGYTPVSKAGDTMTGNLGATGFSMTGATDGSHYTLSNLQTVTIVQNNPFIAWNFSGVMLITNWSAGGTIALVCGGGNIAIAFQVGIHNVADLIYASDQSGYAFYNRGSTANFSVTLIRTRDGA
ncbi:hypothetical protein [Ochrobactrum soli]|uniref:Uncharacterized protein n=1 Tax=Ochrobactrum soli TaxID=2448455 RepID=A0A2P9HHL0_9HYPH|nr:hypothetical protein [[Ochrobactrum] soli]SPL63576.1 hypothetical protein OHAE_3508 [[Ochrobactrum] soli]